MIWGGWGGDRMGEERRRIALKIEGDEYIT